MSGVISKSPSAPSRTAVDKSAINAAPGATVVEAYGDAARAHLAQLQACCGPEWHRASLFRELIQVQAGAPAGTNQPNAEHSTAHELAITTQIAGKAAKPDASQKIIDNFWASVNNPNLPANNQVRDYIQGQSAAIGEMAQQAFPNGFSLRPRGSEEQPQHSLPEGGSDSLSVSQKLISDFWQNFNSPSIPAITRR